MTVQKDITVCPTAYCSIKGTVCLAAYIHPLYQQVSLLPRALEFLNARYQSPLYKMVWCIHITYPYPLTLESISGLGIMLNTMQMFCNITILYCLSNDNENNVCICSIQMQYSPKHFTWSIESTDSEFTQRGQRFQV